MWLALWIACQSFDAVSTEIALQHTAAYELNPVMRHEFRIPLKVGVNVAGLIAYKHHPHKAIPMLFATTGCVAGVLNTRVR